MNKLLYIIMLIQFSCINNNEKDTKSMKKLYERDYSNYVYDIDEGEWIKINFDTIQ